MSDQYTYAVTVEGDHRYKKYVRVIAVTGPSPEKAVIESLKQITKEGEDDLWNREKFTIVVERVY